MCLCFCDCVLVLIAVIFPPLPVWIKRGLCSADSLINILLCCLGYFPGLLHSWYIISRYPEDQYIIFDEEQQLYVTPSHNNAIYVSVSSPRASSDHIITPTNNNNSNTRNNNNNNNNNINNNNNNNLVSDQYGSTHNVPADAPPTYDHVMNDTAKH